MIYLFSGSDVAKTRDKAFEWIAKAREKEPNLSYLRLAREELTPSSLEEAVSAGGLFARRLLVLLDDPFPASRKSEEEDETNESDSVIEDFVDRLAASQNAVVILAPKLSAAKVKKIGAKAKMAYQFEARVAKEERGFNSALVNALGAKDATKLWLEVNRSLIAGDAAEQLHGLLHWKARDLMQKGSRVWNESESRQLSLDLIALLSNSRRKGLNLSESLERFALSI